jgi:four helix bundle protein
METMNKTKITSFKDLDVYQRAYKTGIRVMLEVIPKLPASEKFDLASQLSRSTKAVPRLISEGFAKKHQRKGFQKYIDDAMAESNESEVGLTQCKDLYFKEIEPDVSLTLAKEYEIIGKQLFRLREAWSSFSEIRN